MCAGRRARTHARVCGANWKDFREETQLELQGVEACATHRIRPLVYCRVCDAAAYPPQSAGPPLLQLVRVTGKVHWSTLRPQGAPTRYDSLPALCPHLPYVYSRPTPAARAASSPRTPGMASWCVTTPRSPLGYSSSASGRPAACRVARCCRNTSCWKPGRCLLPLYRPQPTLTFLPRTPSADIRD